MHVRVRYANFGCMIFEPNVALAKYEYVVNTIDTWFYGSRSHQPHLTGPISNDCEVAEMNISVDR